MRKETFDVNPLSHAIEVFKSRVYFKTEQEYLEEKNQRSPHQKLLCTFSLKSSSNSKEPAYLFRSPDFKGEKSVMFTSSLGLEWIMANIFQNYYPHYQTVYIVYNDKLDANVYALQ